MGVQRVSAPAFEVLFCPVAPAALVRICELVKEVTWPAWLCPAGMRQRAGEGFTIRDKRAPPFDDLPCDVHGATGEGCSR